MVMALVVLMAHRVHGMLVVAEVLVVPVMLARIATSVKGVSDTRAPSQAQGRGMVVVEVQAATIHLPRTMQHLVEREVVVQVVCLVVVMLERLERLVWEEEEVVGARAQAVVVQEVVVARAS